MRKDVFDSGLEVAFLLWMRTECNGEARLQSDWGMSNRMCGTGIVVASQYYVLVLSREDYLKILADTQCCSRSIRK